jgi:hypothetical protein
MTILKINDLALNLVAKDFTTELPPMMSMPPINGGPTKTSRALAIIHLAAHDAYAKVTGNLQPQLDTLPEPPKTIGKDEATGNAALLGAGISAAKQLYPGFVLDISTETASLTIGVNAEALKYGEDVADAWIKERKNDKSDLAQLDTDYQIH